MSTTLAKTKPASRRFAVAVEVTIIAEFGVDADNERDALKLAERVASANWNEVTSVRAFEAVDVTYDPCEATP